MALHDDRPRGRRFAVPPIMAAVLIVMVLALTGVLIGIGVWLSGPNTGALAPANPPEVTWTGAADGPDIAYGIPDSTHSARATDVTPGPDQPSSPTTGASQKAGPTRTAAPQVAATPTATPPPTPTLVPTPAPTPVPTPVPTPAVSAYQEFETDMAGWYGTGTGWYVGSSATLQRTTTCRGNGSYGLYVVTSPNKYGYAGAWWELSGQTFEAGHTYRVRVGIFNNWGAPLSTFFGADYYGSGDGVSGSIPDNANAWQEIDLSWTPQVTRTTLVHFGIRYDPVVSTSFCLDSASLTS